MKSKIIFGFIFFMAFDSSFGNQPDKKSKSKFKPESHQFNVFTNQYYFPVKGMGAILSSKYHPGISAGFVKNIKKKTRTVFYYDVKVGLYHHRFIQTGIQLYGDLGYRITLPKKFFIAGELGTGYLHAIVHQKRFEADSEGKYSKIKNFGKPQMMVGLGIKLGKQMNLGKKQGRIFVNYQPWFQFPFIKSYVPLLPNNSLHIGFDLKIK